MRMVTSLGRRRGRIGRFLLVLVGAAALSAGFATAISAGTVGPREVVFTVTSTGDQGDGAPGDGACLTAGRVCTLRAAVEEANAGGVPATVRFDLPLPATIKLGAALQVRGSLSIQGPAAGLLALDAQGLGRHLDIQPAAGPAAVNVSHLLLANGMSAADGGSVIVESAAQPADVTFERVVFKDNTAAGRGGALFSNLGNVTVIDSLFTNNLAASGGAIANSGGTLSVERSTLAANRATADGGALYNVDHGSVGRSGNMTVTVSTLVDNQAANHGGALFNGTVDGRGAATWVRGSTIVRNSVTSGSPEAAGGGAYDNATCLVLNSTILAGNTRGSGAGRAWDECVSKSGSLPARAGAIPDSFLTGGDNLLGNAAGGGCAPSAGDVQIDPARLFVDVLHDQLASYDGSQPMFALRPNSPAIDYTPANSHVCGTGLTVDQRGAPKPLGAACDIGAYEAALPAVTASRTLSMDPGSCSSQSSVELATGALVYSCATVVNTGNVAFARTEISVPGWPRPYVLAQPLAPGQAITLTAAQFPALGPMRVLGDAPAGVFGAGDSQWSAPPGIPSQAAGKGLSLARPVDVAMQVTAKPFGFGAIRTVTATVTYHATGAIIPQRLVKLYISGGTTAQLPAQSTNGRGQAVFSYISFSPLTPATAGLTGGQPARALSTSPEAVQATDFLQMWVDLNGNGLRDPFEPFTAAGLPTAITLASFEAQAGAADAVVLRWRTATEVQVAGFNVLRAAQPQGPYTKVNPNLIPSQGTGLGSDYEYTDHPGAAGTYYYKLEEVGSDGSTVVHGPVTVQPGGPIDGGHRQFLPWIGR